MKFYNFYPINNFKSQHFNRWTYWLKHLDEQTNNYWNKFIYIQLHNCFYVKTLDR